MELLKKLFEGVEGLSEDFHTKAQTLFDANVQERVEAKVKEEMQTLSETFDEKLSESIASYEEKLQEQMSKFLDAVVAEWATENAVAIDNKIKVEIAEKMLGDLKEMFIFNSINLPKGDDKSVVETLQKQVADLGKQLSEATAQLTESKQEVILRKQAKIVESAIKGLADTQADRVINLAESIAYVDDAHFKAKVAYIVEAVTGKKIVEGENPFAKKKDDDKKEDDAKSDDKKEDDKSDEKKEDDKVVETKTTTVVKNSLIEQVLKIM